MYCAWETLLLEGFNTHKEHIHKHSRIVRNNEKVKHAKKSYRETKKSIGYVIVYQLLIKLLIGCKWSDKRTQHVYLKITDLIRQNRKRGEQDRAKSKRRNETRNENSEQPSSWCSGTVILLLVLLLPIDTNLSTSFNSQGMHESPILICSIL